MRRSTRARHARIGHIQFDHHIETKKLILPIDACVAAPMMTSSVPMARHSVHLLVVPRECWEVSDTRHFFSGTKQVPGLCEGPRLLRTEPWFEETPPKDLPAPVEEPCSTLKSQRDSAPTGGMGTAGVSSGVLTRSKVFGGY